MNVPRTNEPGVVPGSATIQNDQPSIEPNNPGDQPDNRLELLYGLSEEDRVAIMALPPDVREPAITALHNGRVGYEEAKRQELATGRQSTEQMEQLMAMPEFAQFLRGELVPQDNVPQGVIPSNVPQQTGNQSLNERFGDTAGDYARAIADAVKSELGVGMTGLQQSIHTLQQGVAQDKQQQDWDALVARTEAQGLPHPNATQSQIRVLMTRNPAMTIDQAYQATLDLSNLSVRPPVTPAPQTSQAGEEAGTQPLVVPVTVTEQPGRNSSAVPRTTLDNATDDEKAIQARKDGTNLSGEAAVRAAMLEATKAYNEEKGTNILTDDL